MFEVYHRKFIEQPFPRIFVGAFETINEAMDKLKLTPEETIEALTTYTESGYQIEQTMMFLGDGLTQEQIARTLMITKAAAVHDYQRAIKKLKKNGKLKDFLYMVNKLRMRQQSNPEIIYTEKVTINYD